MPSAAVTASASTGMSSVAGAAAHAVTCSCHSCHKQAGVRTCLRRAAHTSSKLLLHPEQALLLYGRPPHHIAAAAKREHNSMLQCQERQEQEASCKRSQAHPATMHSAYSRPSKVPYAHTHAVPPALSEICHSHKPARSSLPVLYAGLRL